MCDLTRSDAVPVLPEDVVEKMRHIYKAWFHEFPRPEVNVTAAQLAVLQSMLIDLMAPYVDKALWGPYGGRIMRTLAVSGLVMSLDGGFMRLDIKGPPTIEHWEACLNVFITAMVMLEEVSPPQLLN